MAKSPAFQFYASDFLTDTQSWDINEVGIYIRLLSNQWVNGSLPKDLLRLSRIAGCTHEEIKKAWVILGFKFLDNIDGTIYNKKLETVREAQTRFKEKQASNGSKGGRPPKKETQKKPKLKPDSNPSDNPNESSSSSTSSIKEIYKEKIPKNIEAVRDYMVSTNKLPYNKCEDEAEAFFDHFKSNGWKIGGKSSMQDWKSAVNSWLRRNAGIQKQSETSNQLTIPN